MSHVLTVLNSYNLWYWEYAPASWHAIAELYVMPLGGTLPGPFLHCRLMGEVTLNMEEWLTPILQPPCIGYCMIWFRAGRSPDLVAAGWWRSSWPVVSRFDCPLSITITDSWLYNNMGAAELWEMLCLMLLQQQGNHITYKTLPYYGLPPVWWGCSHLRTCPRWNAITLSNTGDHGWVPERKVHTLLLCGACPCKGWHGTKHHYSIWVKMH